MFLRRYTRTKNGKQRVYFALVESTRTDAGPRQQVVAHLGELQLAQEQRWQRTVTFDNRQGEAQEVRLFPVQAHKVPEVEHIRPRRVAQHGDLAGAVRTRREVTQ